MASPRLKLAETRVKILLAANRKAYSELTSSSRPTISSVVGILSGANEACMRAQSWKTLRDLPDGALFESRSGSKYIKSEETLYGKLLHISSDRRKSVSH